MFQTPFTRTRHAYATLSCLSWPIPDCSPLSEGERQHGIVGARKISKGEFPISLEKAMDEEKLGIFQITSAFFIVANKRRI
jgi:hypothetical protein